jgi:hypothetical protein
MSFCGYLCVCNFWDNLFYSRHNAQFFFELTGFNDFNFFLEYLMCFSLEKMSSDNCLPRVRQRVEEFVANRRLRVEKRQVLSEQNLFRADLRDLVLLPICQMIKENQWEYLYNCAWPAFPRLVREFYSHMIIT